MSKTESFLIKNIYYLLILIVNAYVLLLETYFARKKVNLGMDNVRPAFYTHNCPVYQVISHIKTLELRFFLIIISFAKIS